MRIIKIDADRKTVYEMEVFENSLKALYEALDCRIVEVVELFLFGEHEMLIDEEGWYSGKNADVFFIDGLHDRPYKGNAAIVGAKGSSWSDCTCSVKDVVKRVTFLKPMILPHLN